MDCRWIIVNLANSNKFNLNLSNNKPKRIKISSILCNGLNVAGIYRIKISFLNYFIYSYGQNTWFDIINLESENNNIFINMGEYEIECIEYISANLNNPRATQGCVIINMIFYYD